MKLELQLLLLISIVGHAQFSFLPSYEPQQS
uniref:Uncharacterized protein n=1 Tax=Musa acuminata subsp. malaccensis TaxID=214687 RepID=A0A804JI75_MUSAM